MSLRQREEVQEVLRPGQGRRVGRLLEGRLLRLILDLVYHLATPVIILRLMIPSRFFTRRRYRAGALQRLGASPRRSGDGPCLWLHAVSVGELRAALPLVKGLRRKFAEWDLWVSTATDTAQDLALRSLPEGVTAFYYPIDYGWAVRRALRRVRPTAVVLLELELWPNFLLAAEEAGIPVLVANGRISERSYPRYLWLRSLSRRLFARVKAFAVQSEEYAARFESLGVPRGQIEVLGNLKYDAFPGADPGDSTLESLGWAGGRPSLVMVGGCTHPGEEEALVEIWCNLRRTAPDLKLIVAPRHVERVAEVEALLASAGGLPVARWSRLKGGRPGDPSGGSPLVLVDVVGDLDRFYRLADVVFVGGSLVPKGGHNLLEPARLGKAVLFGPWVSNFEEAADHLLASQAALRVEDREGLSREIGRLLADGASRRDLGERARAAAATLGGATARHLEWLRRNIG